MRFLTHLCLLTLLLTVLLLGGCDRSEGARLVGAWEGTPAEAAVGVEGEPPIESCRFEFERAGGVSIALRLADQSEQTAQARWQVVKSEVERLTVLISLPAEGDQQPLTSQLLFEFEGPDECVVSEIGGDYRVPALILVREGSAAAASE